MTSPSRDQFRHTIDLAVRWGDMDAVGHVNNATILQYVESGRIDYFVNVMNSFGHTEDGPILGEITCRYVAQLKYPADLIVGTRVVRFSPRTVTLQTGIFVDDTAELAAVAHATIVWFDYQAQHATPVPTSIIERVTAYEPAAPAHID